MREIIIDTETTGLSFRSGDRIIEVGCVELNNHIPTGNTLQFYCSVDKKVDEGALKIHGLSNDFLSSHPRFDEQVGLFLDFIKDDTLVIHNAEFDLGFINNELQILKKSKLINKVIDTVYLARKKLNTRIANLDYLCRRFSVDLTERNFHGALLDCHLLADVYLELNGGKQISMNLSSSISNQNKSEKKIQKKTKLLFSKINISKEEVLEHNLLIKSIKNSLWEKLTTKNTQT